jgi:EAL domain-containing protein (putative c-di-GMP-specific phosphodiesterase class I)
VSIALRDRDSNLIHLADVASDLSGTGALPLIDSARLVQAAQMARRLAEKGRRGTVLAELNAESLADQHFEATSRSEIGAFDGQIVLTLAQAQAHGFTNADWATLARLRSSGLTFALADVTSLDMDFTTLAKAGFVFAKLDAQTFLSGLPIGTGVVPPADICRFLAESGLTVIVQGIAASDELARVHACGVHLGQGQVFGGARQMKTSGSAPTQVAAE